MKQITLRFFKSRGKWNVDKVVDIPDDLKAFEYKSYLEDKVYEGEYAAGEDENGVPFLVIGRKKYVKDGEDNDENRK